MNKESTCLGRVQREILHREVNEQFGQFSDKQDTMKAKTRKGLVGFKEEPIILSPLYVRVDLT